MIDSTPISIFRDYVNDNGWTFFRYHNIDKKDKWSCICSAMDWIDVSVQYICKHPLIGACKQGSIEFFSVMSCIDIIVEAIEQLHRVICATNEQIFFNDRDCFPDNPFHQTDREFFKTIRACFGAHPVNLVDPKDPNNKSNRRFASWSGDFPGPGNINVLLYSNVIDEKNLIVGVKANQLESFLEKYYSHLYFLIDSLKEQYESFCEEKRAEIIVCKGDPISRLNILYSESKKRLNNDYYNCTIEELLFIFQTHISSEKNQGLINKYYNKLEAIIDRIQNNLQNMLFSDLEVVNYDILLLLPLRKGWTYWVEKLTQYRSNNAYLLFVEKEIKDIFNGCFAFEYESMQELYVLVNAALSQMCETMSAEIE